VGVNAQGQKAYIPYAVIPLPGKPNVSSQGFPSDLAEVTSTVSHEIAEAVTDPMGNAWHDGPNEVGDITNAYNQYLNGYYVQLISDKKHRPMQVSSGKIYTPKDWPSQR
jgi:hypothetical protein